MLPIKKQRKLLVDLISQKDTPETKFYFELFLERLKKIGHY